MIETYLDYSSETNQMLQYTDFCSNRTNDESEEVLKLEIALSVYLLY